MANKLNSRFLISNNHKVRFRSDFDFLYSCISIYIQLCLTNLEQEEAEPTRAKLEVATHWHWVGIIMFIIY